MALVRDAVICKWRACSAEAADDASRLQKHLAELTRRKTEKLRDDIVFAEMAVRDALTETSTPSPVLTFAEHVLVNAATVWPRRGGPEATYPAGAFPLGRHQPPRNFWNPWKCVPDQLLTAVRRWVGETGVPNGIRTRVAAVKGRCPRPLDDRDVRGVVMRGAVGRGEPGRDRTYDPLVKSQVLYH